HTDPTKVEQDLMRLVPRDQWSIFAHRLIWHGRRVSHGKQPDCEPCTLAPLCPSAVLTGEPVPRPPKHSGQRAQPTPTRAQRSKAAKAAKAAKAVKIARESRA